MTHLIQIVRIRALGAMPRRGLGQIDDDVGLGHVVGEQHVRVVQQALADKVEKAHTVFVVLAIIDLELMLQLQIWLNAARLVVALEQRRRVGMADI